MKVFVGNLSFFCGRDELEKLFSSCGAIENIHVCKSGSGETMHFAFVTFEKEDQASLAITSLNNVLHMGRNICVRPADRTVARQFAVTRKLEGWEVMFSFISHQREILVCEEALRNMFSKSGVVLDCVIRSHYRESTSQNGRGLQNGYGFVEFRDREIAEYVVANVKAGVLALGDKSSVETVEEEETNFNVNVDCSMSRRSVSRISELNNEESLKTSSSDENASLATSKGSFASQHASTSSSASALSSENTGYLRNQHFSHDTIRKTHYRPIKTIAHNNNHNNPSIPSSSSTPRIMHQQQNSNYATYPTTSQQNGRQRNSLSQMSTPSSTFVAANPQHVGYAPNPTHAPSSYPSASDRYHPSSATVSSSQQTVPSNPLTSVSYTQQQPPPFNHSIPYNGSYSAPPPNLTMMNENHTTIMYPGMFNSSPYHATTMMMQQPYPNTELGSSGPFSQTTSTNNSNFNSNNYSYSHQPPSAPYVLYPQHQPQQYPPQYYFAQHPEQHYQQPQIHPSLNHQQQNQQQHQQIFYALPMTMPPDSSTYPSPSPPSSASSQQPQQQQESHFYYHNQSHH